MTQKILITSALPYANGPLHFGHIAGAYLPGDCYARYQRLKNRDVLYICGSDEYGVAITMSAEQAKRSPEEHVNIFHEVNKSLFKILNFSFDHYSRTTWRGHKQPVQQFFLDLIQNGYIEEKITDQLYSKAENKFLADRYVTGECPKGRYPNARGDECPKCGSSYDATDLIHPRSKITNSPLETRKTKHWFLKLDQFKERLLEWIQEKDWKPNVINFVRDYIENLKPRAITRDSEWGVPVPLPNAEGKVLYVWFDAPIGYISATMEWAQLQSTPEKWKDYWFDQSTKLVQFIGKDNIPFHSAIFPAMIMGQNQPYKLVDELPANEFYNLEGKQFSKSDGWYIDLKDFFERYTADQIRYTIAANAPETSDSEFTWKDFQLRCNTDLLGKFGNFVNRVLVFAKNNCGQKNPGIENLDVVDEEFLKIVQEKVKQIGEAYETFKLRKASQLIMELAQVGNAYFDTKKPWITVKQPETRFSMLHTIGCCVEAIKALALVSYPIIPYTSERIWNLLGFQEPLEKMGWDKILDISVPKGQYFMEPEHLFEKVEDAQIAQEIEKLHNMAPKKVSYKAEISIEDFDKLDLRVGEILTAAPIEKSDKLYKLEVDLGSEKRVIVSGIRQHYAQDELIGKKVIVIANLKPAKIRGVESHGMLLAGSSEDHLKIATVDNLPPGSKIS